VRPPNSPAVGDLPERLDREASVDLYGKNLEPRIRLAIILLFVGLSAAGLANVFGQRTGQTIVRGADADLEVEAPSASRGGLIYQVRFTVLAHRDLDKPALVLDPGWFDGLTINTLEPEPSAWEQRSGANALVYQSVRAGETLDARLQFQVNPTAVGFRDQGVSLQTRASRWSASATT
jgi:hypothetical protein